MSQAESAMRSLSEALREWTDPDATAHTLALCLGILKGTEPGKDTKHVFWTSNKLIDALQDVLDVLVQIKSLEVNGEQQYRWSSDFAWDGLSCLPGRSSSGTLEG